MFHTLHIIHTSFIHLSIRPFSHPQSKKPTNPHTMAQEPVEYLYKILVVGDIGTGKTSIIKRYVHDIFSNSYKSTV